MFERIPTAKLVSKHKKHFSIRNVIAGDFNQLLSILIDILVIMFVYIESMEFDLWIKFSQLLCGLTLAFICDLSDEICVLL